MSGAGRGKLDSPQAMRTPTTVRTDGVYGHYYSDYKGTDSNGTGIGKTRPLHMATSTAHTAVASYGTIVPGRRRYFCARFRAASSQSQECHDDFWQPKQHWNRTAGIESCLRVGKDSQCSLVLLGQDVPRKRQSA